MLHLDSQVMLKESKRRQRHQRLNQCCECKEETIPRYIIVGLLLSQYMTAPLYSASTYLFRFRQHAQEFEADAFAVDLGHAVPLMELLVRLHAMNDAIGSDVLYDALHETHPSAKIRVMAIEKRQWEREEREEEAIGKSIHFKAFA